MKYFKLEKLLKGDDPIIRITYKTFWGKLITKDVCKCGTVDGYWVFMENGSLTHRFEPINTFHNSPYDVYFID